METITKTMKKRYLRRGIIYFLTCNLILNTWLPAVLAEVVLQSDGVIEGDITVTPLADGIQNMMASDGAIGHFSDFDIDAGDFVNCVQPSANANALFRVYSEDGTQIFGRFDATGNIYLIDSAGILFGAGSQINVNRLVASSLDITNQDFQNGRYEFVAGGGDVGAVINDGTIIAAEGVALIGTKVINTGNIKTGADGFVVMAAGDRVLLGEPGSNIVVEMDSVTLPGDGIGDVINDGDIESLSGTVILAAGDIFSSALELPKVSSGIGRIEQNGTIRTDGTNGDGGGVSLTAADEVVLAAGSLTTANAGTEGDSGLIVVHSKGRTTVQAGAQIEAKGGHVPHNIVDDFDDVVETSVEISGDYVNFAGDVDASASNGKRGKVIIDALDMTIADGSMPDAPPDNTVYEEWIEQQSYASTDVELVAHAKTGGNIIAEPISDGVIEGGSGDIVLRTKYDTGGIAFMPGPGGNRTAIHTTQGGNIYMLAGGDDPDTTDVIEGGIAIGDIISYVPQHASEEWIVEPGKIRLLTTNYGDITTGQLSVDGGSYDEISVIASGDLLVNGDVTTYAHQVDEDLEVGQARTCLVSEHGNVDITGEVTVEAHGKYGTTADIHIDAGQNIKINLGGGQIRATAKTSSTGPANASVLIHAGKDIEGSGTILITDDGENPTTRADAIYLEAKPGGGGTAQVIYGDTLWDVEVNAVYDEDGNLIEGSHAKLEIIADAWLSDCPDCPTPPGLIPPLPPITVTDTTTTHMGDPVTANVLDNDTLPQGGDLTAEPDEPEHGMLVDFDQDTGEYTYQPEEGFVGTDTFTYVATDGELLSETATVTITVTNTLPELENDTATTHMGDPVSSINVLANDDDSDGDAFAVDSFLYEGSGTLKKNNDGTFTYTPTEGFVGEDSFTYTTSDGQDGVSSEPATVAITVKNALPTLENDTAITDQDVAVVIDVLANDSDPDGDPFSVDGFTYEGGGILVLNDDGTFSFTPEQGFAGQDSFTYSAADPEDGAELTQADVTIMVNPAPVAVPFIAAAPGLERVEFDISGCPALVKWAAAELGIDERMMQIWTVNALASSRDIQPCDACERLKGVAAILRDDGGTRIAALAQVVGEFVSSTAPPTPEQMSSVADVITRNFQANNHYAVAGEYLDALVVYVGVLNSDLNFSTEESIMFAADKYIAPLAENEPAGLTAFIAERLAALGGS